MGAALAEQAMGVLRAAVPAAVVAGTAAGMGSLADAVAKQGTAAPDTTDPPGFTAPTMRPGSAP